MRTLPVVLALLAVLGAGCGEEPAPLFPSYATDVKPLVAARCIRCHGAGGMLNTDPDSTPVLGVQKPNNSDFTRLDDANGNYGLLHYTSAGAGGVKSLTTFLSMMPPPPAPPLTDREYNILVNWAKNPLP